MSDPQAYVIIPVTADELLRMSVEDLCGRLHQLRPERGEGIIHVLAVNGVDLDNQLPARRKLELTRAAGIAMGGYWRSIFCGPERNPYTARNYAVANLPTKSPDDFLFFTDFDCALKRAGSLTVNECLLSMAAIGNTLVYTKVNTGIPDPKTSKHFELLQGFECYDGFTLPGTVIGASMGMRRAMFDALQGFRADRVSGGDADFALRATKKGYALQQFHDLYVTKTIYGMTLRGILEKQIRRGACAAKQLLPAQENAEQAVAAAAETLAKFPSCTGSPEDYQEQVDALFKLGFNLGVLSQYLDAPPAAEKA